jgi:hypothetical protein
MGVEEETNGEEEEMKGEEEETMGEDKETIGEDKETRTGEPQTEVAASANEPVTDLQGNSLFKMRRASKLDWEYVRLVAKKGADVSSICVHASSTPSERVFSHCGVALTTTQTSMRGNALMNQVLLKNNLKHVSLSI